jgi:VWFA-related protein
MARFIKRNAVPGLIAGSVVLLLLTSFGPGRGLEADQAKSKSNPEPALQHEVTVSLKLIQVFVTDATGKPALDLEKSDFVLYDNGMPQTITDFEKHADNLKMADRPAPATSSRREAAPLLSRKFFFIIDYIRNDRRGVMKSRDAVLEFMATKVRPDDEIALYTLSSMSGLTQLEYLTKDHAKVRRKLEKLRDLVGGGQERPVNYLPVPLPPVSSPPQQGAEGFELKGKGLLDSDVFAAAVGSHAGSDVRHQFSQIAAWATALASLPGQKNIILFTQGFGAGVFNPGSATHPLFQTMVRQLASADAPVFSIDTNTGPGVSTTEPSMDRLSKATGGQYFQNVLDYARIAAGIQAATADYYVLGYAIPAAWDGKYHKIMVKVDKPGYVIHVQSGYFDPLPYDKLSPIMKHLHLLNAALGEGAAAARSLDFPLTAIPFARAGRAGNVLVLAELLTAPLRNAVGDRTEFITLVLDENSTIVDGKRVEIDWQAFKAGAGTVFEYSVISLRPGRYDCRAVVRNLEDGRAAVGACAVEVAAPPDEGPVMSPPLLLVKGGAGHYVNLASAGKGGGSSDLSISQVYPFPVKDYVPLVGPLDRGVGEIGAVLKCDWRGAASGEIELACALKAEGAEEGIPVQAEILSATSRDDGDVYLLRFELPELAAGRYALTIEARNADGEVLARTASGLELR